MYGQALKLGLENIRDSNAESQQYEIWAEDIKKEIAQRIPALYIVFMLFIVGVVTLAITLSGTITYAVWLSSAAIGGAPMDFFLSLLLIWLLSKLQ